MAKRVKVLIYGFVLGAVLCVLGAWFVWLGFLPKEYSWGIIGCAFILLTLFRILTEQS